MNIWRKKILFSLSNHLNYSHRNESVWILQRIVLFILRFRCSWRDWEMLHFTWQNQNVSTTFMVKNFWLPFNLRTNPRFSYFVWLHFETSFDGKHRSYGKGGHFRFPLLCPHLCQKSLFNYVNSKNFSLMNQSI